MQGLLLGLFAGLLVAVLVWKHIQQRRAIMAFSHVPLYQRRESILKPSGRALYDVLISTVGKHALIFPKVRVTDLVVPPSYDPDLRPHWQRLQRRCVDFVLCTRNTMNPVLAIKLESRSELKRRQMHGVDILDDALEVADLPLLRLRASEEYDAVDVVQQVRACLAAAREAAAEKTDPAATTQILGSPLNDDEPTVDRPLEEVFGDARADARPSFWSRFLRDQLPTFSRWTSVLWPSTRRGTPTSAV